jgi:hypothetical protein
MAGIFNRAIFNDAIFNTAAVSAGGTTTDIGGAGKPWKQKWREELAELLEEATPEAPPIQVPARVGKAIRKVLDKAPPDDAAAIRALRNELGRLRTPYKPQYAEAMRHQVIKRQAPKHDETDDEEVILLMLH